MTLRGAVRQTWLAGVRVEPGERAGCLAVPRESGPRKTTSWTGKRMADQSAAEAGFSGLPMSRAGYWAVRCCTPTTSSTPTRTTSSPPSPPRTIPRPSGFGASCTTAGRPAAPRAWRRFRHRALGRARRGTGRQYRHRAFHRQLPVVRLDRGATLLGYPSVEEVLAAEWTTLVDKTDLEGDRANLVPVSAADRIVTHVRLTIHPTVASRGCGSSGRSSPTRGGWAGVWTWPRSGTGAW